MMDITGFINTLFKRNVAPREVARKRLQLVLIHDRADITPAMMEGLKADLIKVIKSYLDIDECGMEIDLAGGTERGTALVANIPVKAVLAQDRSPGRGR